MSLETLIRISWCGGWEENDKGTFCLVCCLILALPRKLIDRLVVKKFEEQIVACLVEVWSIYFVVLGCRCPGLRWSTDSQTFFAALTPSEIHVPCATPSAQGKGVTQIVSEGVGLVGAVCFVW